MQRQEKIDSKIRESLIDLAPSAKKGEARGYVYATDVDKRKCISRVLSLY